MANKVLVVDDEKLIVKGIRFSLEQDGFDVECAFDGEEALEMARANEYDIILLDLMLPKMDGLTVCQQIREFSSVPIIMLTAKGEDMDKILGLEYGADGTNYTACTGTEITGLTAGTYHVRTKETATREAGAAASVTVPAYAAPTYDVTITAGAGMTKTDASGAATHTGLSGPMTAVVYTANEGYYFPANYSVDAVTVSGIGVTRNSFTQITVSGTPTGNVEITLAGATAKTKPKAPTTPTASNCTTAANDDGIITGVTTEMEYRKSDATTWTDGAGADITGLAPGTYYVRASLQHRFRVPQQRGFLLRRPRLARCCAGVGRLYTNR